MLDLLVWAVVALAVIVIVWEVGKKFGWFGTSAAASTAGELVEQVERVGAMAMVRAIKLAYPDDTDVLVACNSLLDVLSKQTEKVE